MVSIFMLTINHRFVPCATPIMSYILPKLPYAYDALEPVIDAKTLELHHSKHHAAYVNKLNSLLAEAGYDNPGPIEELIANIKQVALPDNISSTQAATITIHSSGVYCRQMEESCQLPA